MCGPQTHGEEELQLQLALAMSREEADAEETKNKSDDMRLTLAIQKSKAEEKVSSRKSRCNKHFCHSLRQQVVDPLSMIWSTSTLGEVHQPRYLTECIIFTV